MTVTLTLPLADARLIRLCIAHHALGVRPWSVLPGEDAARSTLARLEGVQRSIETAIREGGYTLHPSTGGA